MTHLDGCNLGVSARNASIRAPAGVPVAGFLIDDLDAEMMEWDCWAYDDTHKTMATMTSNGLKSRKKRRAVRSIVTNETPPGCNFVCEFRDVFPGKGDFQIAHAGPETAAPCRQTNELTQE